MKTLLIWYVAFLLSFQEMLETEVCTDFWERWTPTSCSDSTLGKGAQCFSSDQKLFSVSGEAVIINCNSHAVETSLFRCIKKSKIRSLCIEDCIILNLKMEGFLSGKSVSNIEIVETAHNLTTADMVISNIPSLESFNMKGHKMRGRFNASFSDCTNLHTIAVTNTSYTHFRRRPFRNVPSLRNLSFTHGILRSIPETLFKGLNNLNILDLSHNRISTLRIGTFTDLSALRVLDLSYNRLRVVIGGTFKPLANIFQIEMSDNPLSYLPDTSPFGSSNELSIIRASSCRLRQNPNVDMKRHNLTLLDFSYNAMETARLSVFTKNATTVNLTYNLIRSIRIKGLDRSNITPSYYVSNNNLICDCENEEFLQFLQSDIQKRHRVFSDVEQLVCSNKRSVKLYEAWPAHTNCPITQCPTKCTCSIIGKGVTVDCRNIGLKEVPNRIPFGATVMLLQNNKISSLSNVDEYSWERITNLSLDENALTTLQDEFIPAKVKWLSLKRNNLTTLPTSLMKKVEGITDYKIFLSGNNWLCSCENVPFVNWFNRNKGKIKDWSSTFCTGESSGLSFLVSSVPVHLLCIGVSRLGIIFVVLAAFLLVLLLFLSALFYHRKAIIPILYNYNVYPFYFDQKIAGDGGKEFDVFMFYHKTDVEVAKAIVTKLESTHRICIPHGEWYPDQAVGHQIAQSFECSRKTIVLVSRSLVLSSWFQIEFRAAFYELMKNKQRRFVLISVSDHGDIGHLKVDIRNFLTKRMSLRWKECCFWPKLIYALRHTVRNSND